MNPIIDIKGLVVGQLTVLRRTDQRVGPHVQWLCRCTCGNTHLASGYKLRKGLVHKCTECWKKEAGARNATRRKKLADGRDRYEVAKELGITPSAVQMRLARGWTQEEAAKFGRRRKSVVTPPPDACCEHCKGKEWPLQFLYKSFVTGKVFVHPACHEKWCAEDRADEMEMLTQAKCCPAPYLPEDPEELGSLFTAKVVSWGYGRKAPSGKTQRRKEFYAEKTEVHGDKGTGTGPAYDVAVYAVA